MPCIMVEKDTLQTTPTSTQTRPKEPQSENGNRSDAHTIILNIHPLPETSKLHFSMPQDPRGQIQKVVGCLRLNADAIAP